MHDTKEPIVGLANDFDRRAKTSYTLGGTLLFAIFSLLLFTGFVLYYSGNVAQKDLEVVGPAPDAAPSLLPVTLNDVASCGSTVVVVGQRGVVGVTKNGGVDWHNVEGLSRARFAWNIAAPRWVSRLLAARCLVQC